MPSRADRQIDQELCKRAIDCDLIILEVGTLLAGCFCVTFYPDLNRMAVSTTA